MFSSGLSLRQNIKATDDDLYNYKISNDGRVDVLETFKAGLEGTGEGSISDFQQKHEQQATLITTLETNAGALQTRIDTFNAALEDGADGTISTIEQIQLNTTGLAQEIVDRGTEITRMDGLVSTEVSDRTAADTALGGRIDQEISNRQTAITTEAQARVDGDTAEAEARTNAIVNEVVNRNNAIAVETANRQTAITAEATARTTAISKLGFTTVGEAEGILTPGSYPFSFGMGQQSDVDYGLLIPFSYTLLRFSFLCKSLDSDPTTTIRITHNSLDGSTPIELYSGLLRKVNVQNINASVSSMGSLGVEVVGVENMTDDNAKFRLIFLYTSNDPLV
jgi:hypothetical protein